MNPAHISRHADARRCAAELISEYDTRAAEGLYKALTAELRAHLSDMCTIAWLEGSSLTLERLFAEYQSTDESTGKQS